jgi:tyrosine aminotransferase
VAGHSGINVKEYNLMSDKQWECDLEHMAAQVDERTRCIIVNNPSNPTGSNYSKQHLLDILAFAEKHKIPILADEIYAGMVFDGEESHTLASLTTEVPILACGGLAKQFLVPGWRVGWVTVHDRHNRFDKVRVALQKLSTLILGANTLVQGAIPGLFEHTEESYYTDLMTKLQTQARFLSGEMKKISCLRVIEPQGAMYLMVEVLFDQLKDISTDTEFTQKLLDEEFVFVLPGKCFNAPGFVRFVTCPPISMLETACTRISAFCKRHTK